MVLPAFEEEDVYLLTAGFSLGYGILTLFMPGYSSALNQINTVVQSTALGMVIIGLLLLLIKWHVEDLSKTKDKKDELKERYQHYLILVALYGGAVLTTIGIFL